MAHDPNPHNPGPAPIEPKKPLPGQDANLPGQPPTVDVSKRDSERPARQQPHRPPQRGHETNESPADESLDRRENDHVESPGVERELPKDDASRR